MTIEFQNLATVSGTVTISAASLASAAYTAPSTQVDNTPASGKSYLYGCLRLVFGTAITTGSGSPYICIYAHEARDGTNVPAPPGSSAVAPPPNAKQTVAQLVPSVSTTIVDFPLLELGPWKYGFQIFNGSGAAFSATVTLTLYRYDVQGV